MTLNKETKPIVNQWLIKETPLDLIKTPNRIRQSADINLINDLAKSIHQSGLLNPIIITEDFQLMSGERRFTAYKLLNEKYPGEYECIPCRIVNDNQQSNYIPIIENIQRESLTILEECYSLYTLIQSLKITSAELGIFIGKSEVYIENRLRYLKILDGIKKRFKQFRLTPEQVLVLESLSVSKILLLRPLTSHWSDKESYDLLVQILEEDLSVRKIRELLTTHNEKNIQRRLNQESSENELTEKDSEEDETNLPQLKEVEKSFSQSSKKSIVPIKISETTMYEIVDLLKDKLNIQIKNEKTFRNNLIKLLSNHAIYLTR